MRGPCSVGARVAERKHAATATARHRRATTRRATKRKLKVGISCYAHFGGSGVVASELGREVARDRKSVV